MAEARSQAKPQAKPEIDLDEQQKPAGKKHLLLYIVIGLLVVGLGITLFLLLTKDKGGAEGEQKEAAAPAHVEAVAVTYVPFKPFVVNFAERGPARFLQVEFQVTTADPAVVAAVELHTPAIRNDVNMLLAGATFETASTREGKEKMREEIKAIIQRVLEAQKVTGTVDAVYFTSFVMQ